MFVQQPLCPLEQVLTSMTESFKTMITPPTPLPYHYLKNQVTLCQSDSNFTATLLYVLISFQLHHSDENPAPNQYEVKHSSLSSLRRPPSCKIGQRLTSSSSDHTTGPGPAAYNTRRGSTDNGSVITPRRSPQKGMYYYSDSYNAALVASKHTQWRGKPGTKLSYVIMTSSNHPLIIKSLKAPEK